MDSIIDFKSVGLMQETKNFQKNKLLCIAMNWLHFEGRPGLIPSDFPGMGVHRLSPDQCNMGDSINKLYITKNSFKGMPISS